MKTRILVNGAYGKMGQATVAMIEDNKPLFDLVALLGRKDNLNQSLRQYKPDIAIDFTKASLAYDHTKTIIQAGVRPVIGTSGFTENTLEELRQMCKTNALGGVIAPNFSLGMVLAMRYAADAAKWFNSVELIETHHSQKQDAPSGTSIKTAEMIAKNNTSINKQIATSTHETLQGSRGSKHHNIPIHAVRLPGFIAHQTILFSDLSENLTLRHDCLDRSCFMKGVKLACQKVMQLHELVYGLEHLLN